MIGSLIVDQAQVRGVEQKLEEVAEEAAVKMLSDTTRPLAAGLEFHGADLFNGKKVFENVDPGVRIWLCEQVVAACADTGLVFGHCAIDKMKLRGGHPHMKCFQFTLERLQDYLELQDDLGLIVADEHRELEEEIIRDLALSKSATTGWGWRPTAIKNIIDTVHFVKSRHNRLVQACDVLTYFRLKGMRIIDRTTNDWLGSTDKADGLGISAYRDRILRSGEKKAVELCSKVMTFERFSNIWPIS